MQANERGGVYAAVHAVIRGTLTAAERRLLDRALDQIIALRDLHR